jgi:uncharacterized oligopeptide transporter (OPT) family protein
MLARILVGTLAAIIGALPGTIIGAWLGTPWIVTGAFAALSGSLLTIAFELALIRKMIERAIS